MSYDLRFFGEELKEVLADATDAAQKGRSAEVELRDLGQALAQRSMLDLAAGVAGVDAAMLDAFPPRASSVFDIFRRPPVPGFSRKLASRLDDARYHARTSGADKVGPIHLLRAFAGTRDSIGRILTDCGATPTALAPVVDPPDEPPMVPRREIDTSELSVTKIWARIHDEFDRLGELPDDWFNDPADPAGVAELERLIGCVLPDDLRESLTVHNGSRRCPHGVHELLEVGLMGSEWQVCQGDEATGLHAGYERDDVGAGVQHVFWSAAWLPVLQAGGSTEYLCADLAPAAGGQVGQLVTYAMDDFERSVRFRSFRDYLVWFLDALANADEVGDDVLLPDGHWD